MLDPYSYKQAESLARQSLRSWRALQIHYPHVFGSAGFPLAVDTIKELPMLVDTMQEGRFDNYVKELGGLADAELDMFVDVLGRFVQFYVCFFGDGRVPLPLSTMIAHFALFKKMRNSGAARRILEIGPGCGYLSFFAESLPNLVEYRQIESAGSFYLLQNMIGSFLFGGKYKDHAEPAIENATQEFLLDSVGAMDGLDDAVATINLSHQKRFHHYPWWKIGDAAELQYDLITSNANLNEFSKPALQSYATLMKNCLSPDGIILAQCIGGGSITLDEVIRILENKGFAVAFLAGGQGQKTGLVVPNMVLIGPRHPDFSKMVRPLTSSPRVTSGVDWLYRMFIDESAGRRFVRNKEICRLVSERCRAAQLDQYAPQQLVA